MASRFRFSLSWQILLAGVAGLATGKALGHPGAGRLAMLVQQACETAGMVFLSGARAFAAPLIVSSIILGATGLEPMRGLSKLIGKTALWIASSNLLAVLVGAGVVWGGGFASPSVSYGPEDSFKGLLEVQFGGLQLGKFGEAWGWPMVIWGWLGLVLLSLGFGFYRNQIEEGHARLLGRFCQGVDEVLALLLGWAQRFVPIGIFFLTAAEAAKQSLEWRLGASGETGPAWWSFLVLLTAGWTIYGLLALPGLLWAFARINPWKFLRALAPAILMAAASGLPEAALPLTFDGACRRAGISRRVTGATLPLCVALQRDGAALGWMVAACCVSRHAHGDFYPAAVAIAALAAWLVGCGLGALTTNIGAMMLMMLAGGLPFENVLLCAAMERLVAMGGAAVSVWSHACAAAVIAYSEGERQILSSTPLPDPLASDAALDPFAS
jgi:proton glutamate symport protein